MEGTISIPYFNITEPVTANYDGLNNRQRFDFYNELVPPPLPLCSFPTAPPVVAQKCHIITIIVRLRMGLLCPDH